MPAETITVQMTRSDSHTTWGFRLQGGKEHGQYLTIGKVIEGGLADRAGLKEGDHVIQICNNRNADSFSHGEAQQCIMNSGNNLKLIVDRNVSTIWSPSFPIDETNIPSSVLDQNTTGAGGHSSYSKDYSKKTTNFTSATNTNAPYSQSMFGPQPKPYSPAPFGSSNRAPMKEPAESSLSPGSSYKYSKQTYLKTSSSTANGCGGDTGLPAQTHFSPAATRNFSPSRERPRSPAAAYLEKTGGLFGTEPHLSAPKEEPAFLKSETLKLIQEQQSQSSPAPYLPAQKITQPIVAQDASGLPVCENCGQRILGVFCKAGGKTLHGDCFKCSTCGTSLKNIGYFLINEKLYCDLHAKQQKTNQFKATAPVDPNIFATYGAPPLRSPRSSEPIKAFYQPDVLKPGGEIKSFSPSTRLHQHDSYSNRSAFSSSNETSTVINGVQNKVPSSGYSPAPFTQHDQIVSKQKAGSYMSSPAGDGIQLFGPKTPNRGRGILKQLQEGPRIPICQACNKDIRGPFVLAMSKTWCPDHFVCGTSTCRRQLIDTGFIEQNGAIYCEHCYEKFYAPNCSKCQRSIIGDCLTALQRQWHPECFTCTQCHKPFGNASFFLENGQPYCETDWNALFTTKCNSCQFPIEAGDRWVEALGHSYHSDCFCCTVCQKTLEGQNFYAKSGRPYCKIHA